MNKYFLLLLMLVFPIYGWSCSSGANYGDVTMANLPEQILINAGVILPERSFMTPGE